MHNPLPPLTSLPAVVSPLRVDRSRSVRMAWCESTPLTTRGDADATAAVRHTGSPQKNIHVPSSCTWKLRVVGVMVEVEVGLRGGGAEGSKKGAGRDSGSGVGSKRVLTAVGGG